MLKFIVVIIFIILIGGLWFYYSFEPNKNSVTSETTADTGEPINIVHRRLYYEYYGKDINISAIIPDDTLLKRFSIVYRNVGDNDWFEQDLKKEDKLYTYTIKSEKIYSMGIQYYLLAEDINENIIYFGRMGVVDLIPESILINIIDLEPPVIKHESVSSVNNNDYLKISVNVTDNISVERVKLFIKDKNDLDYLEINMEQAYADIYLYNYKIESQKIIEYYLYSVDKYGNSIYYGENGLVSEDVKPFLVKCIDIIPPVIEHKPITFSDASQSLEIISKVKDNIEVKEVFLFFRPSGVNRFKRIKKEKIEDSKYSALINRYEISGAGIEYYISATDINNNISYFTIDGSVDRLDLNSLIFINVKIPVVIVPEIPEPDESFVEIDIAEEIDISIAAVEEKSVDPEPEKIIDEEKKVDMSVIETEEESVSAGIKAEGVLKIVTGAHHTLILLNDGTVWSWGENLYGQLGEGTTTNSDVPVKVFIDDVIDIAAGRYHSLALLSDGRVQAWGNNTSGQIGNGTTESSSVPVRVKNISDIARIESGYIHNLVLDKNGNLWGWGNNVFGQLGDGTNTNRTIPVKIDINEMIKSIACGYGHSLAITESDNLFVWGNNSSGQLGINSRDNSNKPVLNSNISNLKNIYAGQEHSIALKNDGTVMSWGDNRLGQLGVADIAFTLEPIMVEELNNVKFISSFSFHNIALCEENNVYGWGNNFSGQLGFNFDDIEKLNEYQILLKNLEEQNKYIYSPVKIKKLNNIVAVSSGFAYSAFLDKDNNLWFLGDNRSGQFGNKSISSSLEPVKVILTEKE